MDMKTNALIVYLAAHTCSHYTLLNSREFFDKANNFLSVSIQSPITLNYYTPRSYGYEVSTHSFFMVLTGKHRQEC